MALTRRVATGTTAAVALTAVLVGGAAFWWASRAATHWPIGLGVLLVAAAAVAMPVSHTLMRQSVLPAVRRLEAMTREVRNLAARGVVDRRVGEVAQAEVAELAVAVNRLLDRLAEERQSLVGEATLGVALLGDHPDGVAWIGANGRVQGTNARLGRLLAQRGPSEGKPPIETIGCAELQALVDAWREGAWPGAVAFASGALDLRLVPVRLPDESLLVYVRDETSSRDVERARSEFVANVSHELRTPMSAVLGYAELVLGDRDRIPADVVPLVETIDRNARRMRDLFEALLQLHRVESRRRELPLVRQPLASIIAEAVGPAVDNAARRCQTITVSCPESLQAWVSREALGTILANLVGNASRYTADGGVISVVAAETDGRVVITVTDNGVGIDRSHHDRIFERFYRVDEGRARADGGTGLGLALVRHLALASGCRIELSSEVGQGSEFRLVLPTRGRS